MHIKNASELVENGRTDADKESRRLGLDAVEHALAAVEPGSLVRAKVRLSRDGGTLIVGRKRLALNGFRRVFIIGGGKASRGMALALEEILSGRITGGVVNVPESQARGGGRIRFHGASHPLPSAHGEAGVREMLDLVGEPTRDTLVICLISGGGSAMLPMPREGIALSDKVETTWSLLRAGANIKELNVVRKHLSGVKGGWLAVKLFPAAVLSLVISDVVGNPLDSIASGPLYPDPSTFRGALDVIRKYRLTKRIPPDAMRVIMSGVAGEIPDTPKPGSRYFERVSNIIIGSNEDACKGAVRRLRALGCNPVLLTAPYEGESARVGERFGLLTLQRRTRRPRSWVAGGETTVTVTGEGVGGRNQEFALGAATKISGNSGVAIISIGTDGVDGPTDAAGAIVDGSTVRRAHALGLKPGESLRRNDSYEFFEGLGDLVITGPTGTNVNDVCVIVSR